MGVILDGCPAGISLEATDFTADIERRKGGMQKGTTPRKEDDLPIFLSGVFNGKTTGAPLTIIFENNNTRSGDYEKLRSFPRPGHADFVASQKFGGFEDYRGGGHFSGRLTVCIVAAGVVAKKILFGNAAEAIQQLLIEEINKINTADYTDQRVVIKGCGELAIPQAAYVAVTQKLRSVAKSIMYGEPCSTVPVYKKKA